MKDRIVSAARSMDRTVRTVAIVDLSAILLGLYAAREYVDWRGDLGWWVTRHLVMVIGR